MKIVEKTINNHGERILSLYDFDELHSLEDVKELIDIFLRFEFSVHTIVVREFDDWENGPLVMRYSLQKFGEVAADYAGKTIETYSILGKYEDSDYIARIVPSVDRLILDHPIAIKDKVGELIQYIDAM